MVISVGLWVRVSGTFLFVEDFPIFLVFCNVFKNLTFVHFLFLLCRGKYAQHYDAGSV